MKHSRISLGSTQKSKQVYLSEVAFTKQDKYDISQIGDCKHVDQILTNFQDIIELFARIRSLNGGPLRHLKVEPHYREPTSRLWLTPQTYRKTCKIRLTGNWIEKAGFICHERIRVIPMHRMLIIVPETQMDTNE